MNGQLSGKVIAITGAASGIGLACVRGCLDAGARVVMIDNAEDKLRSLAADLGENAIPLRVDLTNPESVAGMMPGILDKAGHLDAFHANAGAYIGGDFIDGDPDAFDRMLNLNVNAVFRTVHAVLPHMIERARETLWSPVPSPATRLCRGSRSTRLPSTRFKHSSTR